MSIEENADKKSGYHISLGMLMALKNRSGLTLQPEKGRLAYRLCSINEFSNTHVTLKMWVQ